jgi:hypothetical protein
MKLVRVVAPHFVAAFITDGDKVVQAAPILSKRFIGLTEDQARKVIDHFGWKASVIPDPQIIQHEESFEVRWPGGRKFFYYEDHAGRRAISGRMTKEAALIAAQSFLNGVVAVSE